MKARRLRLPPTPSPAVEDLRAHLRAIYSTPMPWHSEAKGKSCTLPTTADTAPQPDASACFRKIFRKQNTTLRHASGGGL